METIWMRLSIHLQSPWLDPYCVGSILQFCCCCFCFLNVESVSTFFSTNWVSILVAARWGSKTEQRCCLHKSFSNPVSRCFSDLPHCTETSTSAWVAAHVMNYNSKLMGLKNDQIPTVTEWPPQTLPAQWRGENNTKQDLGCQEKHMWKQGLKS